MDYGMALHLTKGVKLKVWKNKSLVMFHAKVDGRWNAKQCDDNNSQKSDCVHSKSKPFLINNYQLLGNILALKYFLLCFDIL